MTPKKTQASKQLSLHKIQKARQTNNFKIKITTKKTTHTFHDTQENAGKQSALLSPHEIQKNLSPTKTQIDKQL